MNDKQEFPMYIVRIELSKAELEQFQLEYQRLVGINTDEVEHIDCTEANELIARIKAKL